MPETGSAGRLLGRDYWLVQWSPGQDTTSEQIAEHLDEHVSWLLGLEFSGQLLMSGPLVEGPEARPGAGVTVLRATTATDAGALAQQDPFVRAGLRTFTLHRWRVNEGSVGITVSLGTGRYEWR